MTSNNITITVGCYTDLRGLSQEDKLRVLKVYKDAGYKYSEWHDGDGEFLAEDACHHYPFIVVINDHSIFRLALLTAEELNGMTFFKGYAPKHIPVKDILESIMNKPAKKRVYAEATCDGDTFHKGDRIKVIKEYAKGFDFGTNLHAAWINSAHLNGGDWKRIEIEEDTLEVGAATAISSSPSQCLLARIRDAKLEADKAEQKLIDLLKEADEILGDTDLRVDIYR